MGRGTEVSKVQPNENDCPTGPDYNHVFKSEGANGEFRCVYCDKVERFDIFNRRWE